MAACTPLGAPTKNSSTIRPSRRLPRARRPATRSGQSQRGASHPSSWASPRQVPEPGDERARKAAPPDWRTGPGRDDPFHEMPDITCPVPARCKSPLCGGPPRAEPRTRLRACTASGTTRLANETRARRPPQEVTSPMHERCSPDVRCAHDPQAGQSLRHSPAESLAPHRRLRACPASAQRLPRGGPKIHPRRGPAAPRRQQPRECPAPSPRWPADPPLPGSRGTSMRVPSASPEVVL